MSTFCLDVYAHWSLDYTALLGSQCGGEGVDREALGNAAGALSDAVKAFSSTLKVFAQVFEEIDGVNRESTTESRRGTQDGGVYCVWREGRSCETTEAFPLVWSSIERAMNAPSSSEPFEVGAYLGTLSFCAIGR